MGDSKENVVLVSRDDVVCGTIEKINAHKNEISHRTVSVFLLN